MSCLRWRNLTLLLPHLVHSFSSCCHPYSFMLHVPQLVARIRSYLCRRRWRRSALAVVASRKLFRRVVARRYIARFALGARGTARAIVAARGLLLRVRAGISCRNAAVCIQSATRALRPRRFLVTAVAAARRLQRTVRRCAHEKRFAAAAQLRMSSATRLQAHIRGLHARKHAQSVQASLRAVVILQCAVRARAAVRRVGEARGARSRAKAARQREQLKVATLLQRAWRCLKARRLLARG